MKNNQNIFPQPLPAKATVFDMYSKSNTIFFTDKGNLTTGHWFMFRKFATDSLIKRGEKLQGNSVSPSEDCISPYFENPDITPVNFQFCEIGRYDEKPYAVFLSEDKRYIVINGKWVRFFMQCGADEFLMSVIDKPVIIKKNGELMGLIMPIWTGNFRFEREKNIVEVIEHFHKLAHNIPTESVKAKIINHLTGRGNTHIQDLAKAIKEPESVVEKVLSEIGFKNISDNQYIHKTGNFYRLVVSDTTETEVITEKIGNPKILIENLKVMPGIRNKIQDSRKQNKMWQKPFQFIPYIEYQRLYSILTDNDSDFFSDDGRLVTIGITHKDEYVLISVKEQFWSEYGL